MLYFLCLHAKSGRELAIYIKYFLYRRLAQESPLTKIPFIESAMPEGGLRADSW